MFRFIFLFICLIFSTNIFAEKNLQPAITTPIPVADISDLKSAPPVIKQLVLKALQLSKMNLTYLYGSADPKNKGMDCSGTIYYLLNQQEIDNVPRSSDQLYVWAENKGNFHKVTTQNFDSSEFSQLKPGDLLFWSGTYAVKREHAITHVMIYLGKNAQGQRLMFGSSDGRTYLGKKMWGVSVFDFKLPDGKGPQRFEGYGCIPDLSCKINSSTN